MTLPLQRVLFVAILTVSSGPRAEATTVIVVDHSGIPRAGVTVLCTDPDRAEKHVTGTDGHAVLPPECKNVECLDPDEETTCGAVVLSLPGATYLPGPGATCRLEEHVRLAAVLPPGACQEGCTGTLARSAGHGIDAPRPLPCADANSYEATVPPGHAPGQPLTASFPTVRPGRFRARFDRTADGWSCSADLGAVQAVPRAQSITVAWRDPVRIMGRVLGADSKPAAGVAVQVLDDPGEKAATLGAWYCETKTPRRTVSDAKGRFELSGIDPGRPQLLVAGSWEEPRGIAALALSEGSSGEAPPGGAATKVVTLKLERPVRVVAKLLEPGAKGAACTARLIAEEPLAAKLAAALPGSKVEAACGPEGKLALGPFAASPFQVVMRPDHSELLRAERPRPKPGSTVDLGTIKLRLGDEIQVAVKDEGGAPIEGAEVSARGTSGGRIAVKKKTDAEGEAHLSGLPSGSSLDIGAEARGYRSVTLSRRRAADSPFTLTLGRASRIVGDVVDPWSEGLAGAQVCLRLSESASPGSFRSRQRENLGCTRTDKDGAFDIDHLPPGKVRVEAGAPGHIPADPLELDLEEGRTIEGVHLVVRPAPGVHGRVLDPSGEPTAGALVSIGSLARTVTAADGTFRLARDTQSEAIVARAPGFGPAALSPIPADETQEVTLRLTEAARLLVHLPPGTPQSAQLTVRDGIALIERRATGGGVSSAFDDLAPGPGSVWLESERHDSERRYPVELLGGQQVELTLDATGGVEGTVTVEGEPWPTALVTATRRTKDGLTPGEVAFSDERGHYRIEGLLPGPRRLVAFAAGARGETDVIVAPAGTTVADLALTHVILEAQVLDRASGSPIEEAWVHLRPKGTSGDACGTSGLASFDPSGIDYFIEVSAAGCVAGRTGDTGQAQLAPSQPGAYQLSIDATGYEGLKADVDLGRGTTPYRALLSPRPQEKDKPAPRTLLRVTVDAPDSARQGTLTCRSFGSSTDTMTTPARRGTYDCGPLPQGPGEAFARAPGWGTGRVVFTIGEESPQSVTVAVPHGGTLLVPIPDDRAPAPEVHDADGASWTDIRTRLAFNAQLLIRRTVPGAGLVEVFDDLPPGTYTAVVGGAPRAPVVVRAGAEVIAW